MIPTTLLKNYQNRALAIAVYGNGGLEKTLAARLFPPPILLNDFEGGSGPLGPWTRRIRRWNEGWTEYDDADRQRLWELVPEARRKARAVRRPAPLIDIIGYDTMFADSDGVARSYDEMYNNLVNLDRRYSTVAVDPLIEFSQITQTKSKTISKVSPYEPMHVRLWQGAQERAAILLRALREYRDKGVFIYLTSSEFVDKDYGDKDPREQTAAQKEEPYAIKGAVNVPGQLVGKVNHMIDILIHVRMMNGNPTWVLKEEAARSGTFNWEAKDRTGRVAEEYLKPNVMSIIRAVYGQEAFHGIYDSQEEESAA